MHVTLVGGFDPDSPSAGGVRAYVDSLGRVLDLAGVPHMTILSGNRLRISERSCTVPVKKGQSTIHLLASLSVNLANVPVPSDSIIHVQRPDDLLPFALGGVGLAWVCTLHGDPFLGMIHAKRPARLVAYAALERFLLRRVTRAIFVDGGTVASYLGRYPWLRDRFDVIPNATDASLFRPGNRRAERIRWGFKGTTFLYAGRLAPEKRVVDIVRAFRNLGLGDCQLVIAGDGPERSAVAAAAAGTNIKLLGPVPRVDMPSLMNAVDAVVLYSTREGIPSTALEALACGTPVVSTPVGAVRDFLMPEQNGYLVSTMEDLMAAMKALSRGEIATGPGISQSVEAYTWTRLGPKMLASYAAAERLAL